MELNEQQKELLKDQLYNKVEFATKELEASEPKFNCEDCQDTGFIEKIEWVGTDTSYPRYVRCNHE